MAPGSQCMVIPHPERVSAKPYATIHVIPMLTQEGGGYRYTPHTAVSPVAAPLHKLLNLEYHRPTAFQFKIQRRTRTKADTEPNLLSAVVWGSCPPPRGGGYHRFAPRP